LQQASEAGIVIVNQGKMAAVSAPQVPSALTPPGSSHGDQAAWKVNQEVGNINTVLIEAHADNPTD